MWSCPSPYHGSPGLSPGLPWGRGQPSHPSMEPRMVLRGPPGTDLPAGATQKWPTSAHSAEMWPVGWQGCGGGWGPGGGRGEEEEMDVPQAAAGQVPAYACLQVWTHSPIPPVPQGSVRGRARGGALLSTAGRGSRSFPVLGKRSTTKLHPSPKPRLKCTIFQDFQGSVGQTLVGDQRTPASCAAMAFSNDPVPSRAAGAELQGLQGDQLCPPPAPCFLS